MVKVNTLKIREEISQLNFFMEDARDADDWQAVKEIKKEITKLERQLRPQVRIKLS